MAARLAQATLTLCASTIRIVLSGLTTARIEVVMLIVAWGYNLHFLALISMNLFSIHGLKWRIFVSTLCMAYIPISGVLSQINTTNSSDCFLMFVCRVVFCNLLVWKCLFFLTSRVFSEYLDGFCNLLYTCIHLSTVLFIFCLKYGWDDLLTSVFSVWLINYFFLCSQ